MDSAVLLALVMSCAPQVDVGTARALIAVESGFNPFAIGVVGGVLERQPTGRNEAIATAKALQAGGWNFSVGLAQINLHNFGRLGLSVEAAFEPCTNLAAMQTVLTECFERASQPGGGAQRALRQALSCYYSGNFVTGFRHGYVRRVLTSVQAAAQSSSSPVTLPEMTP
jgi:type IV secretion system protein VirB1